MSNIKCPKCGEETEVKEEGYDWGFKCSKCDYDETNKIGKLLSITGKVIIGLGLLGSVMAGFMFPTYTGTYRIEESYNTILFLICAISSFVSGLSLMGFGELISLNQKIFSILRK